ncbi:MAG: hypothetical protein M3R14_02985 [Acidobacteriota bacterium]|nr:hypothetical protein [Acidobacteriota bacterium]
MDEEPHSLSSSRWLPSGYLVYLFSPSWIFVFFLLTFAMAWSSMASPAIFAVVGGSLPKERRAMGFSVQSILKGVPMTIAPIVDRLQFSFVDAATFSTTLP